MLPHNEACNNICNVQILTGISFTLQCTSLLLLEKPTNVLKGKSSSFRLWLWNCDALASEKRFCLQVWKSPVQDKIEGSQHEISKDLQLKGVSHHTEWERLCLPTAYLLCDSESQMIRLHFC